MRAHDAEHLYVQMPCGVMDQLISSCGQYGKISLIDCITHDITHYDIDKDADPSAEKKEWPVTILKLFVHVEHKLVNSEYTERVKECVEGERLLKEKFNVNGEHPIQALCRGPTLEMQEQKKGEIPPNVYDRCYHGRVGGGDDRLDDPRDRADADVRGPRAEGRLGGNRKTVLPVL